MEGKIEYSQFKSPARKGEKLRQYVKFTSSQQISHRWTELVRNSARSGVRYRTAILADPRFCSRGTFLIFVLYGLVQSLLYDSSLGNCHVSVRSNGSFALGTDLEFYDFLGLRSCRPRVSLAVQLP